ncbi:hypothetical protein CRYUN_Cryun02cG0161400 [Craigia yunnanensis]
MFGRASKKSDNTRYYEILGVSKNASQDDLKKAFKKAAIKNHPDKGGDPEKVLSDPEKCEIYDQYGENALKEGMGGGAGPHDPFDIFSSFFGGSNHERRQRQGEDVVHPLKVSLEDLYLRTSKKLLLSRNVICSKSKAQNREPHCSALVTRVLVKALEAILPLKPTSQLTDMELNECEETTLYDVNIEDEIRRKQQAAQEAYDEDQKMHGGA